MTKQAFQSESNSLRHHITSNLIAASAGTGKTYQLASRYITLLVLGARPEEIIALTFTRKAAGEFRNRILHALAEGACDKRDKNTGRNELAVRVWDVLSGLTIDETGKASALQFVFGETTDIEEVEREDLEHTIYDLQGRKLSEITEPGIYIIDGKKIFVK